MPYPMKIQPIDSPTSDQSIRCEPVKPPPPAAKWRFRRLFERQFPGVLKISAAAPEKPAAAGELHCSRDGSGEFEPSSVCLGKMVQNFIEDSSEKPPAAVRCGRRRCNCFNGNCYDDAEDEFDGIHGSSDSNLLSSGEACEILKSLVPCVTVAERNLLADVAKVVERNKIFKRKDDLCRKIVAEGLVALGYDASICKSRWDKSPSYPAGEYEYVDVIFDKERMLIDIDFRSEFEIARSTKSYKAVLQALPQIFVGKPDRLQKIISVVTEAAKQSLRKKGMPVPPWRKSDYVNAKWLSPYTRTSPSPSPSPIESDLKPEKQQKFPANAPGDAQESRSAEETAADDHGECLFPMSESSGEEEAYSEAAKQWMPPPAKPKSSPIGVKIVTGLSSMIGEKP